MMPRSARILVDGGIYHAMTRGNNGQTVFHQEFDYQRYLQLLSHYARSHGLNVHHFALMPNHVHLVLRIPTGPTLSRAMLGLNLTYALYYHKRHRGSGHLWQGRFKSFLIDRESYLLECGRYIELNPVRAGLVQDPRMYAWSSYRVYAEGMDNPLITPNPLYETLGSTPRERQERYRQFVRDGCNESTPTRLPQHPSMSQCQRSIHSLEDRFGVPSIRKRRGRPKKLFLIVTSPRETSPFNGK